MVQAQQGLRAVVQRPLLHPGQVTKHAAVRRGHGGAQIHHAVGVGAQQGDLGQSELRMSISLAQSCSPMCIITPPGFTAASADMRLTALPTASMT
jgi:hypothetical protein